eukprot:gene22817-19128_t
MATTEKQQEWNLYQHKAELEVATESWATKKDVKAIDNVLTELEKMTTISAAVLTLTRIGNTLKELRKTEPPMDSSLKKRAREILK